MTNNHSIDSGCWVFNARTWAGLMTKLDNNLGMQVFKAEILNGTLFGMPYYLTNAIDTDSVIGTEVGFFIRDYITVIDSTYLEIDASSDASFTNSAGVTVSAFEQDLSVFRTISRSNVDYEFRNAGGILTEVKW